MSETPNLTDQVQAAHREAFALCSIALGNPNGIDLEPHLIRFAEETDTPIQSLLNLAQVLVWHAAGALLTYSGSIDGALELIQAAALQQETEYQESTDE